MLIAAATGADGGALIGRAMGVRPTQDWGGLDLFISRAQWTPMVEALAAPGWVALTLCRAETYETYQVKGPAEAAVPADADDKAFADGYVAEISSFLRALGVAPAQMAPWLTTVDLVRVRMAPQRLFQQTPGPGAGQAMAARP